VYLALDSDAIIVVWKAASSDSIDFIIGTPSGPGTVKWGKVGVIPGAATTTTPAVEAITGKDVGSIYVVWKAPGPGTTGLIDFAVTADRLPSVPTWTKPRSLPSAARTPTAPLKVPHVQSANGTAINPGVLAAHAPGPVRSAWLSGPNNAFYEPFVRPCAGLMTTR
jgi:hypothetical protein